MSVILETSLGTLTIDLFVDDCPQACKNFLKLCKIKYYNNCIFHKKILSFKLEIRLAKGGVVTAFMVRLLYGEQAKYFKDEIKPYLKHSSPGMVSMANRGSDQNASQFFITTGENLESLDGKHTIFGQVEEGLETLSKINNALTDKDGRPLQVIRIRHSIVLDDPFPDPVGLEVPSKSPPPVIDAHKGMLPESINVKMDQEMTPEDQEKRKKELEKQQILVELGDIPDADIKPPDDVLFVCRLNPMTTETDLETIFSRFGVIEDCEIIRDKLTGDSLCYAFIKYDNEQSAIEAYFKMNKVLIDERRIHVDFSQSVAKVDFKQEGGWKNFFKDRAKEFNKGGGGKFEKPDRVMGNLTLKRRNDNDGFAMVGADDDEPVRKNFKSEDRRPSYDDRRENLRRDDRVKYERDDRRDYDRRDRDEKRDYRSDRRDDRRDYRDDRRDSRDDRRDYRDDRDRRDFKREDRSDDRREIKREDRSSKR